MEATDVRKLKLYIATTLDGYIAGPNDEIDWLDAGGWFQRILPINRQTPP